MTSSIQGKLERMAIRESWQLAQLQARIEEARVENDKLKKELDQRLSAHSKASKAVESFERPRWPNMAYIADSTIPYLIIALTFGIIFFVCSLIYAFPAQVLLIAFGAITARFALRLGRRFAILLTKILPLDHFVRH